MEAKPALAELRHVSMIYGSDHKRFVAIQDINLNVKEGEFVALLGPSGSGKSTLLRILIGLQPPTEGEVLYRGSRLQGVNPHAAIVFQTFALFPWLTVQENVEVALKARDVPPKLRMTRALDLLDRVGLDGFETAYPRELSGGMRQKVGFARAMAVEPELLCLDEPFSALDVLSAESLRGELLELWMSGNIPTQAILMVSHNIEEAVFMADRIVIMDKEPGRVIADEKINLPHPRHRKSPQFLEVVDRVYALLAGQTQPESIELGSAPGEMGRTRGLQNISINDLAGLLEHISDQPNDRQDLYKIAEQLNIDSDHLLQLTEAAEMLGFATVTQGDFILTPLGETFAEASIQARKEIFASRLRRVPFFKWLLTMLRASDHNRLKRGVILAALEREFPPEDADEQLEIAANWGRYAELLAYDDDDDVFYLEPSGWDGREGGLTGETGEADRLGWIRPGSQPVPGIDRVDGNAGAGEISRPDPERAAARRKPPGAGVRIWRADDPRAGPLLPGDRARNIPKTAGTGEAERARGQFYPRGHGLVGVRLRGASTLQRPSMRSRMSPGRSTHPSSGRSTGCCARAVCWWLPWARAILPTWSSPTGWAPPCTSAISTGRRMRRWWRCPVLR